MPLNILLLGVQGSGKGTQAKRIADEYGLAHVSTGDMLRGAVAEGTELGRRVQPILERGELVPDELMIELIRERLGAEDTAPGFVLDGFPRTTPQAQALDTMLAEIDRPRAVVCELQVPDDVATEHLPPGVTTAELAALADEYIGSQGGTPSFQGSQGYPPSICTSPNDMVV